MNTPVPWSAAYTTRGMQIFGLGERVTSNNDDYDAIILCEYFAVPVP